jgi:hypothetical protein
MHGGRPSSTLFAEVAQRRGCVTPRPRLPVPHRPARSGSGAARRIGPIREGLTRPGHRLVTAPSRATTTSALLPRPVDTAPAVEVVLARAPSRAFASLEPVTMSALVPPSTSLSLGDAVAVARLRLPRTPVGPGGHIRLSGVRGRVARRPTDELVRARARSGLPPRAALTRRSQLARPGVGAPSPWITSLPGPPESVARR